MAWIFSLSAECGPTQEAADSFADHFNESSWVSSYLWKPYQGEVYSPLRASSQLREKLNELLVVSSPP